MRVTDWLAGWVAGWLARVTWGGPRVWQAQECCPTHVLLSSVRPAELAGSTSIIFTRTCDSTRRLALTLRNLGFGAVPIHGQMSQPKRLGALNKFKVRGGLSWAGGGQGLGGAGGCAGALGSTQRPPWPVHPTHPLSG